MLASAGRLPREDEQWAFEIKWDGVRAIVYWQAPELRIESRSLNDVSSRYPELRALGDRLGRHEAVLDGEIVSFDGQGVPSFERLQRRMHVGSPSAAERLAGEQPVTLVIFDLLYLDGMLTFDLPYSERRALLSELDLSGPTWQTPANHIGEGHDFVSAAAQHGLEGVVAKRLDSPYRPGERVGHWLKIKNISRQELVIGGWLPGNGGRAGRLGALLMGYYEQRGDQRVLRYAGRAGTGFNEAELERLDAELCSRARSRSPFAKLGAQPPRGARFVEPNLVAEVEFSDWTREGVMRHPVYKGLRGDKPAMQVELEIPTMQSSGERRRDRSRSPDGGVGDRRKRRPRMSPYRVLRETKQYAYIEVDSRSLRLSNREKILYPAAGFTKGELIDYYAAIAPVLVPHLEGRPLTLKRYPNGVEASYFYEKQCPSHRPDWIKTAPIASEREKRVIDYCLVEDLPSLIWVANLASLELHPSLSLAADIDTPTTIVFDLDPGEPAGMPECVRVALLLREIFESLDLRCFVKGSGSKGLQIYLPLNTPVTYEQTKTFARALAELLEARHPRLVVSRMAKNLREGKVFIDWSQNDIHKTTVCTYSLRASESPTVSAPLSWEEVESFGKRARAKSPLSFSPLQVSKRVERDGDLFAEALTLQQSLPALVTGNSAWETL